MHGPGAPRVRADHLTVQASPDAPQPVLDDVSFRVGPGQALLVEGPSGCGKSTLLHLLAGHASFLTGWSYSGRLVIEQAGGPGPGDDLPSPRGRTAYVPQDAGEGLLQLDVLSAVRHAAESGGVDRSSLTERMVQVCRRYDIVDLLEREVSTLSVGERKRVAFAAVELRDPDLVLLDEPLAGLDPHATRLVLEDIQRLHDKHRTLVVAEHRGHLLEHLVDQKLVLPPALDGPDHRRGGGAGDATAIGRTSDSTTDPRATTLTRVGARTRARPHASLVRAQDLSVGHGDRTLLEGGDLDLGSGLWYLVGPNGAGKTTLLSVLAGLVAPRSGTVTIAERPVWPTRRRGPLRRSRPTREERRLRASCRIAFQDARESFLSDSVIEELRAPQQAVCDRSAEDAEAAAVGLLERCRLLHLAERSPLHLSVGEARRVQLIDGLLTSPHVWLVDEPTPGLDERSLQVLRSLLARFADGGGCAIVATHEPHLLPVPRGWLVLDGSGTLTVTKDDALVASMGYDVSKPSRGSLTTDAREVTA